jgi:formate dehydrogenase subunit gamma
MTRRKGRADRSPSPPPAPLGPNELAIDEIVARHRHLAGPLLPILHAVQERFGYLPPEGAARIAHGLNLSAAEVHGVITFYHDFRTRPPGRHVLRICRAEACQAMGSDALTADVQARLRVEMKGTTADGRVTLEPVYCLGNCALSPAVMIDGRLHGRVTADAVERWLAEADR